MLRSLSIQNFKGWENTGEIRLAPLSVFFGTNSSGKSSIGHLLLLLKQTVENADRKAVIYPGNEISPFDLGTFRNMFHGHDIKKILRFSYLWDVNGPLTIEDSISQKKFIGNRLCFSASLSCSEKMNLNVDELSYSLLNSDSEDRCLDISMKKKESKDEYEILSEAYPLKRNVGRGWDIKEPVRFYGFPDSVVANFQNAEFVQKLNFIHEHLFGSVYYLGPLRDKPKRLYTWPNNQPASVGYSGENTISAILAAQGRKISYGKKKQYRDFQQVIAEQLLSMGLIKKFEVQSISDHRQDYEVKIGIKASQELVDLPDVGFGISQVLPVIVQLFFAPHNSIILIEQPEIHLHPFAQSMLADVMISAIKSREENKDRNIQLLIETHSEHFLRRLQRHIAEETISTEDVAAYFVDSAKEPSSLTPLKIDRFGNISNWPDNFFGDEMGDIAAQSLAAFSRMQRDREDTKE